MLASLLISAVQVAQAQYDQKAKTVLDAMSSKYKQIPAFNAKYSYQLESKAEGISQNFSGEIMVKNDMYVIKTEEQEIFNNGRTVWIYLKNDNEVTIMPFEPEPDEILPGDVPDMYKSGFKYAYLGEKTIEGKIYELIDLNPEDRNAAFYKVSLVISKDDKTIRSWQMFNRSGRIYTYTLRNFTPLKTLSDAAFAFDTTKHPKVLVIDNR